MTGKASMFVPESLRHLSVWRSVDKEEIRIDDPCFGVLAHTGSGKTMIIPGLLSVMNKCLVLLRQPTRGTAYTTYKGLKMFWGDKLRIGIKTSENKEGGYGDSDLIVVTDGIIKYALQHYEGKLIVVFDEIHDLMGVTELELGLAKTYLNFGRNVRIVLLTATIRPENLMFYFEDSSVSSSVKDSIRSTCEILSGVSPTAVNTHAQDQRLKFYYAEGVSYEIEDKIHLTENYSDAMDAFVKRMQSETKRGLIFMTTRNDCISASEYINEDITNGEKTFSIPAMFCHADVEIQKIVDFVNENDSCIVIATKSLATSVTLPFDEVLIMDKGIDSRVVGDIVERQTGIPLDNNSILQRRGRVGRVKPGICTLVTRFNRIWEDIKPVPIDPPLEKMSISTVVLTSAKHGIDISKLDVLSDLDKFKVDETISKLEEMRLIERVSDKELSLTYLGKKVIEVPLTPEYAMSVVTSPEEILPAIVAISSFEGKSLYHMSNRKNRLSQRISDDRSFLITRVNLVREAFKARSRGNRDTTLRKFCDENGLWFKAMKRVLTSFGNILDKGLRYDEKEYRQRLIEMDVCKFSSSIIKHMSKSPVFKTAFLSWNYRKNSYGGNFMGLRGFISRDEASYLDLDKFNMQSIRIMGNPSVIKKEEWAFVAWGDVTVLDSFDDLAEVINFGN